MAHKVEEMELAILGAVDDKGTLLPFDGGTEAQQVLSAKFPSDREQQDLEVTVQYLVEQRFLFPAFADSGRELSPAAGGITPKGAERLRQLQGPRSYWMGQNWFPLTVAIVTALIGIANTVVTVVR